MLSFHRKSLYTVITIISLGYFAAYPHYPICGWLAWRGPTRSFKPVSTITIVRYIHGWKETSQSSS